MQDDVIVIVVILENEELFLELRQIWAQSIKDTRIQKI